VTPRRRLRQYLSHSPALAGDLHDGDLEPRPRQESKALWPEAEGTGAQRERPATGYCNHALASELPYQPQTLNLHHNKPDMTEARATTRYPHATVTPTAHGIGVKGAGIPTRARMEKALHPVRPTLRILHLPK
jgi:hypothetical protein